ncbi:MAG: transcriptional regulator [Candidatus Micrarchaeia archaeon]
MGNNIIEMVDKSKKVNSKIVSLHRMLILFSLEELIEGSTYRDLKAGLEMDDGILFSNLAVLEDMCYVKKEEKTNLDGKNLTVFNITEDGKNEVKKLRSWLEEIIKGESK